MFVRANLFAVFNASVKNKLCIDLTLFRAWDVWIRRLLTWLESSKEGLDNMVAMNLCWQI